MHIHYKHAIPVLFWWLLPRSSFSPVCGCLCALRYSLSSASLACERSNQTKRDRWAYLLSYKREGKWARTFAIDPSFTAFAPSNMEKGWRNASTEKGWRTANTMFFFPLSMKNKLHAGRLQGNSGRTMRILSLLLPLQWPDTMAWRNIMLLTLLCMIIHIVTSGSVEKCVWPSWPSLTTYTWQLNN
jgi:hypothetical protein